MKRKASAEWQKNLKEGKGTISTESKTLENAQYSFSTRFEEGKGTNPEELVAAAHAGCFSMALSHKLSEAGHTPDSVKTTATVTLEKLEAGFEVTSINLEVDARVPGVTEAKFNELAEAAKIGCPISKLMNTTITMTAKLEAPAKA